GCFALKPASIFFCNKNFGSATLSRISTKLFNARSAIASASGLRRSWYSLSMVSQSSPCLSARLFNTEQSSKPQFMPCPKNGTIACAASPINANLSSFIHGKHFTVISDEVGLLKKSSVSEGISFEASANVLSKNDLTFSFVSSVLNDGSPSKGKKSVHVKLPSVLGKAISI